MIRNLALVLPLLALIACGNSIDLEKGETKVIKLIQDKLERRTGPAAYIDARKLVSRAIIDGVDVPILFVEIDRGQNGTMTQYPGEGVGQTWLGVDGSTVTLDNGTLKATRGVDAVVVHELDAVSPASFLYASHPKLRVEDFRRFVLLRVRQVTRVFVDARLVVFPKVGEFARVGRVAWIFPINITGNFTAHEVVTDAAGRFQRAVIQRYC